MTAQVWPKQKGIRLGLLNWAAGVLQVSTEILPTSREYGLSRDKDSVYAWPK